MSTVAALLGFAVRTDATVGGLPFAAATEDDVRLLQRTAAPAANRGEGQAGAAGIGSSASVRSCPFDRRGVAFYRGRYSAHRAVRGLRTPYPVGRKPRNCADADYLAEVWPDRSLAARKATDRYLEKLLPDVPSWQQAIALVQPLFPNTAAWLDSCSDAEGMSPSRDRQFYVYGFKPFSWDAWESNTVGNPMQMRPGTFIYFYNRALSRVRELGYRLPAHLQQADARSWQSMTAAALAGGYARWSGEDNSHWSASWGRGC